MSDLNGLAIISFFFMVGFYCFWYLTRIANEFYFQVLTGVIDGNAVSIRDRVFHFNQTWVGSALGAVAVGVFIAVAELQLAEMVGNPGVKWVAYLAAFIGAVGGVGWLATGINGYIYCMRAVRGEAEESTI